MPPSRYFHVRTFGCQMNDYDSLKIARLMEAQGWGPTEDPAMADLILVNTCSIREKAEARVFGEVGRLKPYKDSNPGMILVVAGCVAQQGKEELGKALPYVDLILGTHQVQELPRLVEAIESGSHRVQRVETGWRRHDAPSRFYDVLPAEYERVVTQPLTIIEGCDKVCSFCIVPHVRGREVSRPAGEVVEHARRLVDRGVREVTLLGQNVNSYGNDLEGETTFARLLEALCQIEGLDRIRFTTSHPRDFGDDVIAVMAANEKICDHLHLPVQSGSDPVLDRMRRGHTLDYYKDRIQRLRSAIPDLRLTTDLIVGFPGESDTDFEATMNLIRWARFDSAFSFKYSPRPGTSAARMDDDVAEPVKQARLEALQALIRQQSDAFLAAQVGRSQRVLVEDVSRRGFGDVQGRTGHNLIVNFPGPPDLIGRTVDVEIARAFTNSLQGRRPQMIAA